MTDEIKPFVVTFEEDGQRLDKWINFHFNHVSKIMMEKLCRTGQIRVNSSRVKPNFKLFKQDPEKGQSYLNKILQDKISLVKDLDQKKYV